MITAILLASGAIAVLAWIVFNLAVYALPFYAGVSAASLAYAHGAGFLGAALVGLVGGAILLALGQITLATSRSPTLRILTLVAYAIPAAVAGFAVSRHVAAWTLPNDVWQTAIALVGGAVTAGVACVRLTTIATAGRPDIASDQNHTVDQSLIASRNG